MGSWCVFSMVLVRSLSFCLLWCFFLCHLGRFGAWFEDVSSYSGVVSVHGQAWEFFACMVLCFFLSERVGKLFRGSCASFFLVACFACVWHSFFAFGYFEDLLFKGSSRW